MGAIRAGRRSRAVERIGAARIGTARIGAARIGTARIGVAALGAVAVVASVAVFPVVAEAAPAQATVRGVVTVDGDAVAGVPVGTWSPTKGVVARATTDARGRFTLHSPTGVAVDAFAGTAPTAAHAVFAVAGDHLVRGIIGAAAPTDVAESLYQRVTRARPAHLGAGHALHFRLERAGRFTASSPVLGRAGDVTGEIEIEHGDGPDSTHVYGPEYTATESGSVTSGWLVPGRYRLVWNPATEYRIARSSVVVESGTTVTAPAPVPTFSSGATLTVHATSGGSPVPAGVPVVGIVGSEVAAAPATDANGTMTERTVAPGAYRFVVGQYFDDPDEGLEGPPSSDDYLTKTVVVQVPHGATTATATVDLAPASKLSGTVDAPAGSTVRVLAEDSGGTVVRSGYTEAGAFTLGGLPAGTYTVFAIDVDRHRYAAERITLAAAASVGTPPTALAHPLTPATAERTVHGTVSGARGGTLSLESAAVHGAVLYRATGRIGTTGTYSLRTIPGRFAAVADATGRVQKRSAAASYTASVRRNFASGSKLASVTVRFLVHGHAVAADVLAYGYHANVFDLEHTKPLGTSSATEVTPGRYLWGRALLPLPAVDGPWYYRPPTGSFVVHAGTRNDLGTRPLTIRG